MKLICKECGQEFEGRTKRLGSNNEYVIRVSSEDGYKLLDNR